GVANSNVPAAFADMRRRDPTILSPPGSPIARVERTKQVVHIADAREEPVYIRGVRTFVELVDLGGVRTMVIVPMLKDEELVGAFLIYRQEGRPFADKQIGLLKNFAKQAVIAIENTRLLNELRQRTDSLTVALEHQTATSEILSSISGSITDTKPVFEAIVRNLRRLL